MYSLDFKEAEDTEIKQPTFPGSWRRQGNFRKTSTTDFIDYAEAFDSVDPTNCSKFLKR